MVAVEAPKNQNGEIELPVPLVLVMFRVSAGTARLEFMNALTPRVESSCRKTQTLPGAAGVG